MASLELSRSTALNSDSGERMHRPARSMGRGSAHREPDLLSTRTGSRNNPKLKVLVRSHAMREETSPPREPSPPPCISIVTSPPPASPPPEPPASPGAAPLSVSVQLGQDNRSRATVRTQDSRRVNGSPEINVSDAHCCASDNNSSTNNSSPTLTSTTSTNQKTCVKIIDSNFRTKSEQSNSYICDCLSQICAKCSKSSERNINNNCVNTLSVGRAVPRHRLAKPQGSSEGSGPSSPCLSRDSSTEQYTDCTGIDLQQFIVDTLNKNSKDRALLLKIEQELVILAKDKTKTHYKFPCMSSYQRMLVHRCAAYFGMEHNVEPSGKCVVVCRSRGTRIPEPRFREYIRDDVLLSEEPRRSILKRDSSSLDDCGCRSPDRLLGSDNRRSKSFEEREEEYEKVRRRIFKDGTLQDCDSQEEFMWSEVPWPEADAAKIRLLPPEQPVMKNRLLKVQSMDGRSETSRPCVAKSYSFGGYGGSVSVLSRGDSVTSTHSAGPRLLTKQDSSTSSLSWRLSPSSSGYKSQSQRSDSVTPSPTATPHRLSDTSARGSLEEPQGTPTEQTEENPKEQIVWAVTDMQSVPKGSVLINPQTGQPFTNQDGSIYHFDPSNPPPGFSSAPSKPPPSPVKLASPRKSPVKEAQQSPRRSRTRPAHSSPAKQRTAVTHSATSPILPGPGAAPPACHVDNASNLPIQPYPVCPAGYPGGDGTVQIYPQTVAPVSMVYGPYGVAQQFDNRPDPTLTDLSGYFMNMGLSDPSCAAQPVSYQQPATYWNQQAITYYQPATTQPIPAQRYSVQPQGTYLPQTYPGNFVPVPPGPQGPSPAPQPTPAPPTNDMVSLYNAPMSVVYPPGQYNASYMLQSGNPVMYAQNSIYPQNYPSYPPNTPTPNSSGGGFAFPDARGVRPQPQRSVKGFAPRMGSQSQGSAHSSGGSSSPANTVVSGYFSAGGPAPGFRQCTPPDTPPTQNVSFGFPPPNYMQQSMIFRPMGSIRASPPVNIRSSRSPTPAPEFSQGPGMDRGPRYPLSPALYGMGMHCILPGDMRLVGARTQPSVYKQPSFRPNVQPLNQSAIDQNNTRSHKPRKTRTKVPALPPSGRQSNQPVPMHSRF